MSGIDQYHEYGHLTDDQQEVVDTSGRVLCIGDRGCGKTEALVHTAIASEPSGDVIVIAPNYRMAVDFIDRVEYVYDELPGAVDRAGTAVHRTNTISAYSAHRVEDDWERIIHTRARDSAMVLVDAATEIPPDMLFGIERESELHGVDVTIAATKPYNSIVLQWAKHSPYWTTVRL
jgi:energy-coupling factor transporter ATP-binding protein EcfA2